MRRLEGVIERRRISNPDDLKNHSLFFDKLHLVEAPGGGDLCNIAQVSDVMRTNAELDYLEGRGYIDDVDEQKFIDLMQSMKDPNEKQLLINVVNVHNDLIKREKERFGGTQNIGEEDRKRLTFIGNRIGDIYVHMYFMGLVRRSSDIDTLPIVRRPLPDYTRAEPEIDQKKLVFEIALQQIPTPGPTSAWENIFEFKQEMHDKQWHFRRFLNSLSTKKQTEAEVRDDLEWTLNEYTKAMKIHHLKSGNSFADVYMIPALELVENVTKFNWSKIAKGALSVRKRQVGLMESEMKAPGRECAYVFEAQKRFCRAY